MVKPHRLSWFIALVKGGKLLISILFLPNLDQIQSSMKQRHCVYMNAILIWNHQSYFCCAGGAPAAVISGSTNSLQCSCPRCPDHCTHYHWYHTKTSDPYTRTKRSEHDESITVEEEGQYICRSECGKGFSRFSDVHSYEGAHTHTNMLFRLSFYYCFIHIWVTLYNKVH